METRQKTPIALAIKKLKEKRNMWDKLTKEHTYIKGTYTIAIMVLENLKPTEREMFEKAYNNGITSKETAKNLFETNLTQE